jgi:hypothetical protein
MGGMDVISYTFLTSALDEGKWSASRAVPFNPRERASGTHWIGGWVGPTAGLEAVYEFKFLFSAMLKKFFPFL